MSRITLLSVFFGLLLPMPGLSEDFVPVRDKDRFISLVRDRELRLPLYGIRLSLSPDGQIQGKALGWGITGKWVWQDGYFCRNMDWSGYEIPYNCQLVEARGEGELRFTVDRGKGDQASFRLR